MSDFLTTFETYLANVFDRLEPSRIKEAMTYSLLAGGKRIRPLMIQAVAQRPIDDPSLLKIASALEMIHTYSLIHDDLPCMDDDDLRRGRPTCHIQYGEAVALLAGDGLLTEAFQQITQSEMEAQDKVEILAWFSKAAGCNGMILGQDLDMLNESGNDLSQDDVLKLYQQKTGALFGAALVAGAILAKIAGPYDRFYQWGLELGFLFQVQDDCLEMTSDASTLGKSTGSDVKNAKATWMKRMGSQASQEQLEAGFERIKRAIMEGQAHPELIRLIEQLQVRTH